MGRTRAIARTQPTRHPSSKTSSTRLEEVVLHVTRASRSSITATIGSTMGGADMTTSTLFGSTLVGVVLLVACEPSEAPLARQKALVHPNQPLYAFQAAWPKR